MPLRLDNASALPTCPQLQQKQQQTADRNWPKNHPHDCAKKLKKFAGFVILALAVLPTQAWGQTSQQYALMGKKLWAAFACAAITDVTGEEAEENRLFKIGYEQGK